MATTYVDLLTIEDPTTGQVASAAWGDQIRENFEAHEDPPFCNVFASAAVLVATGTDAQLAANSERFDNDALHSTVTNTSRITIQKSGRYRLTAAVSFSGSATGSRKISFLLNGTTESIRSQQGTGTSAEYYADAEWTTSLVAGDYVEVRVQQGSGGNLNVHLHEFTAKRETR